jgi:hypothetical protein
MIPKRLNSTRRVVSRIDPAWKHIMMRRTYQDYCNTLDIAAIGPLDDMPEPFTFFEVQPLRVSYEVFAGDNPNYWEIFRSHVVTISGMDIEKDGDRIRDKHREEIGPDFVKDIAEMVIQMANGDGQAVFFMPPATAGEFIHNCLRSRVREAANAVSSAVAKRSE